jgi:hypothetical protein
MQSAAFAGAALIADIVSVIAATAPSNLEIFMINP